MKVLRTFAAGHCEAAELVEADMVKDRNNLFGALAGHRCVESVVNSWGQCVCEARNDRKEVSRSHIHNPECCAGLCCYRRNILIRAVQRSQNAEESDGKVHRRGLVHCVGAIGCPVAVFG